eukprot:scaffold289020_cov35-Attheya_sp.AAC.1
MDVPSMTVGMEMDVPSITTCAVHHYWGCVAADGRHRHSVAALPHFRPTPYIVLHAHIYSRSMQSVHAADDIRFA